MSPSTSPPDSKLLVAKENTDGICPECGDTALQRYPVLSEGGWFEVVKCRECLASLSRTPWSRLGTVTRLEDTL
ncbi:hypothetical protein [Frankia sp. Cppng1_Ct_nod]|uniref:hypothetical protein n=1 Tax=Frankia sp. Cppng1_Ct_nod TaxID=2897162 RepID=UPI0010416DE3|nr:hypothetical protein [Frankia sp. Cppng1_Ct_nod]